MPLDSGGGGDGSTDGQLDDSDSEPVGQNEQDERELRRNADSDPMRRQTEQRRDSGTTQTEQQPSRSSNGPMSQSGETETASQQQESQEARGSGSIETEATTATQTQSREPGSSGPEPQGETAEPRDDPASQPGPDQETRDQTPRANQSQSFGTTTMPSQ